MEIECYKLNLGADAPPTIGTGNRVVYAEVGYKWVRLCSTALNTARMPRKAFDRAVVEQCELSPGTRAKLREAAHRHLRYKEVTKFRKSVVRWLS